MEGTTAGAGAYSSTLAGGGGGEGGGGGGAAGGLDIQKFVRQPLTIVRLLSWVFAIVVFGSITAEGYVNPSQSSQVQCMFNQNDSACQYAVGVGVLAFLACVAFLLLDVYVPYTSSAREKKYAVVADLGFSGVWTFLWFVCFCLLANQWSSTQDVRGIPEDAARATIAFSFFSIATWGTLTYFALGRFRRGVHQVAIPTYLPPDHVAPYPPTYAPASYNPTTYIPTTYTAYPSDVPDAGQQSPYPPSAQPQGDYQPPNY